MNVATACHFPEDLLESYAMGKLSDQEGASFEEHLLICPTCQKRLAEMDEFLGAARTAMSVLAQAPPSHQTHRLPNSQKLRMIPKPIWAASLVGLFLILLAPLYRGRETEVALTTMRSAASPPLVRAGGGFLFRIDATQIPQPDGYQLEVVDSSGQPIWHAAVEARNDQIVTSVSKRLAAGRYWIRLYDTGSPWTLLREYGLDVR
jgi:anti-sigma factor RsiW